jgi:GST-like protein
MIDLYTSETPNGWKISITLEELAIPYTVHALALSKNEQKQPEYLKLNPNGRIPTIVDRDNGDFAVFESGAIMIYLAERAGKLLPKDVKGRSRVIQWLMFQMGGIGPIADIANWSWVSGYAWSGVTIDGLTHLQRWIDTIGARPAVRRGRAVPPPADLGAQDAKTVEGARKILA